jgi:hypothetical protein
MTASRTGLAARRFAAIVGSVALATAAGACGGSEDKPVETPSSSSAEEPAPTSDSPAESQVAEKDGAQLEVPAGWEVEQGQSRLIISAPEDDLGYSPGFGLLDASITLSENTEALASNVMKRPGAKRMPDVEFGGVVFFHVREGNDTNTIDTYGTVIDGSRVTVTWTFLNDLASPKQIDELVNQVMPSFKFEG